MLTYSGGTHIKDAMVQCYAKILRYTCIDTHKFSLSFFVRAASTSSDDNSWRNAISHPCVQMNCRSIYRHNYACLATLIITD